MDKQMSPYSVIKRPLVTEKSTALSGANKYIFEVDSRANKPQIKEAVEKAFDVTVKSVNVMVRAIYLGSKYAIPHMIRNGRGSIINTASVHGYLAAAHSAAYEASKAAVINLSRQIAVDFGPRGIRCNAICPGWIITEKGEAGLARHPERYEIGSQVYPVRRGGRPIDIAYGAVYLASDESTFVSGHALVIDGGMTAWLQDSMAHHIEQYLKERDAK